MLRNSSSDDKFLKSSGNPAAASCGDCLLMEDQDKLFDSVTVFNVDKLTIIWEFEV